MRNMSPERSHSLQSDTEPFSPMRWQGDSLGLLDQTKLPAEEVWLDCRTPEEVAAAIYRLSVRGAPAIGVAAAYGLALGVRTSEDEDPETLRQSFESAYRVLHESRPTAVNLFWALERGRKVFEGALADDPATTGDALLAWARELHRRDVETNRRIGEHGARLFAEGDRVLTHCNAGALATAGYGTAIGVIHSSFDQGKVGMVWVDETRPLLQGARLTAWELKKLGVPFRVVTDNSAGALLSRGHVDRIVVGADRIAANGDAANKIGTYTVAVLAQRHGVPFYVAAPLSTIDPNTPTGDDIPIEERDAGEVTDVFGTRIAPDGVEALNLAFDVTPAELITGIITEVGVLEPPYGESIAKALAGG
jgi:methylthioribose-1-phosphate isomerase